MFKFHQFFPKNKLANKKFAYTVIFEPLEDGGYNVFFPAIPEICTFGEDLEEARAMAEDALRCHLEGLAKEGELLPLEKNKKLEAITENLTIIL